MGTRDNVLGYLGKMEAHSLGVHIRQDEPCRDPSGRTCCTKDIAPGIAGIARRPWACALLSPDACDRALLTYASLILEPDLKRFCLGIVAKSIGYSLGEVFLKVSWASMLVLGCSGRTVRRTYPSRAK